MVAEGDVSLQGNWHRLPPEEFSASHAEVDTLSASTGISHNAVGFRTALSPWQYIELDPATIYGI